MLGRVPVLAPVREQVLGQVPELVRVLALARVQVPAQVLALVRNQRQSMSIQEP